MSEAEMPVVYRCEEGIGRVRFNRPCALNAIDVATSTAFFEACQAIAADPRVRVVVVSGAGRAFMAGGDLAAFHDDLPAASATAHAIIAPLNRALELLAGVAAPVLMSCHGAVAGAGVSMVLAGDLAIAADDARFTLAYAKIGASLDGGSSWALPRVLGLRKAMELALFGDTIDANAALGLGLVNRVVPATRLADETEALARRLAAAPTVALGRIKRLLRTSFETAYPQQLGAELRAFQACAATADFAEGLEAFFGKRKPVFKGV